MKREREGATSKLNTYIRISEQWWELVRKIAICVNLGERNATENGRTRRKIIINH